MIKKRQNDKLGSAAARYDVKKSSVGNDLASVMSYGQNVSPKGKSNKGLGTEPRNAKDQIYKHFIP